MTNNIIGSDKMVIWIQEDKGQTFSPLAVSKNAAGFTGLSVPGATRSETYGTDEYGNPVLIHTAKEAPSGLPGGTLELYEKAQIDIITKKVSTSCPINIHSRINSCGNLANPNLWDSIDLWSGGIFTDLTLGDKPMGYDGAPLSKQGTLTFDSYLRIVRLSLVNYTTSETENALSIDGVPDILCSGCQSSAYRGENRHLFIGTSAASGVEANVLFSINGSGSWVEVTAKPFAIDEDIDFISVSIISSDQFRVVVGTGTTDIAGPANFAYGDVTMGDEANLTFTPLDIAATVNGDVLSALEQTSFDRGYLAATGDIYVSVDGMVSDPGAAIYVGAPTINGFSANPDGSMIWAFGDTNTILLERDGDDTFIAKVGPSGGGNFTALTVANDGLLYAGNGQSLYISIDEAGVTGNWSVLKDFGLNKEVVAIECVKTESQLLRVFVNDSVAGAGTSYESIDGGATFTQYKVLANSGYNDVYFSNTNPNKDVIVGDIHSGFALIQGLTP